MLRCTGEEEEDFKHLCEAELIIGKVVSFVNTAKSRAEELHDVESQFYKLLESVIISEVGCYVAEVC